MRIVIEVFAALIARLVGGLLGALSFRDLETGRSDRIVVAPAFELVNQEGERISFWGVNEGGQAMIAFGSRGIRERATGQEPHHLPGFGNPENQTCRFRTGKRRWPDAQNEWRRSEDSSAAPCEPGWEADPAHGT
jgi:hypothetical protein